MTTTTNTTKPRNLVATYEHNGNCVTVRFTPISKTASATIDRGDGIYRKYILRGDTVIELCPKGHDPIAIYVTYGKMDVVQLNTPENPDTTAEVDFSTKKAIYNRVASLNATITTYQVNIQTAGNTEQLYNGNDLSEAMKAYNSASMSDLDDRHHNETGCFVELLSRADEYRYIYDEEQDDYPFDVYFDDTDVYELVGENEFETVSTKAINAVNSASDELLNEVYFAYKKMYGGMQYSVISIENADGEQVGTIQLRIADHTHNVYNNDRFENHDFYLSVVIADKDATAQRFSTRNASEGRANEMQVEFNSDNTASEIIEKVNAIITELSAKIMA